MACEERCEGTRLGRKRGCGVLGKGRAGRGGMESGKGMGREREGEGSNARRLLTCGQDLGWREEPAATSPATSLTTGGDHGDPEKAGGVGTAWGLQGLGWGRGLGRVEQGLGRTLPPASASNLADPCPDPRSSLICLSSKAVNSEPGKIPRL